MSSFHNAPVTKGLMLFLGSASLAASIFDVKHYFHLQLVPHLSKHHQYWRLLTNQLIFGNNGELMITEILLFSVALNIERTFGSRKYASFLVVSVALSILFLFVAILLLFSTGINYVPPGPISLVFTILYQHYRIVPSAYHFRVSSLSVSDKGYNYLLAMILAVSDSPGSVLAALVGVAIGQLYRSDLVTLKNWRIPPSVERFSKRFLLPLIGSTRPPRRPNRALPPEAGAHGVYQRDQTTASPSGPSNAPTPTEGADGTTEPTAGRQSMMSQWVDELTGRRGADGVYVPTDAEIATLTNVFPDVRREEIVATLQRGGSVQSAVETLLRR